MRLDDRSERHLVGVHPHLVEVVRHCFTNGVTHFIVTEGVRTTVRQAELIKAGASQTMRSRHLTGHAVDLAVMIDGEVRWDWPLYYRLAAEMKVSASLVGVPIVCGVDWKTFPDGPHYQLPWDKYPTEGDSHERTA